MGYIFKMVNILGVNEDDIKDAFGCKWRDFEDCVQYCVAVNNKIKYIVTDNIKDYNDDSGRVVTSESLLKELTDEND